LGKGDGSEGGVVEGRMSGRGMVWRLMQVGRESLKKEGSVVEMGCVWCC